MHRLLLAGFVSALAMLGQASGEAPTSSSSADSKPKRASRPMSEDIRRAIAWERHKDLAAARQAQLEAKHPSVTYADRSAHRSVEAGKPAENAGPPAWRRHQQG